LLPEWRLFGVSSVRVARDNVVQTLLCPFARKSGAQMGPLPVLSRIIDRLKHRQECLCHKIQIALQTDPKADLEV